MDNQKSEQELYNELSLYTLELKNPTFIHQYIVDAYTLQNANEQTKPIAIVFALIGLYLHLEKNYSGKEVQLAHMKMGKVKKEWPKFKIPNEKGKILVKDVLKVEPGVRRDEMINKWSESVWKLWDENHPQIRELTHKELGI